MEHEEIHPDKRRDLRDIASRLHGVFGDRDRVVFNVKTPGQEVRVVTDFTVGLACDEAGDVVLIINLPAEEE